MGKLRTVKINYDDGTTQTTNCAGHLTDDEVRRYYVGTSFNHGDRWDGDPDRMVTVTSVELLPDLITCPHCGHGQIPAHDGPNCNIPCCGKPLNIIPKD